MCGIVGYIGNKQAQNILVDGLKRLEYRGYDSAGVATVSDNKVTVVKAKGKVAELAQKIKTHSVKDSIGIGHTRWATHGAPLEKNAHPHIAGDIALVHNGIIENYKALKEELEKEGAEFTSDTDSEVLAHLINSYYQKDRDVQSAVEKALKQIRGTFGIVVFAQDDPSKLVAARRGSPLLIGVNNKDLYIASDATALVGNASNAIYLKDDEIAICQDGDVDIFDLERQPQKRSPEQIETELATIQKQGYDHFLLKEIMEQPSSVAATTRGRLDMENGMSHLGGLNLDDHQVRQIQRIQILGCGTAFYAGVLGKYLLEKMTDIPVDVEVASEFRYREPVMAGSTVGIVISQSGETADTLASAKELNQRGVPTLGLVNVVGSTIAREVKGGVYLHAGPEISVASTKAFTSQVAALLLFGLHIARRRTLPLSVGQEIVQALEDLPGEIEAALKLNDQTKELAQKLVKYEHAMYMGRDTLYPIALEGALKLKEVSYIHAEGYSAGEMKHGPIALIDDDFLVTFLLGKGPLLEKSMTNLEEVKSRHSSTVVVTDDENYAKQDKSALFVKTSSPWTQPLVMNIALQLLAYHVAVAKGTDVDQPRNLAKSVTVE